MHCNTEGADNENIKGNNKKFKKKSSGRFYNTLLAEFLLKRSTEKKITTL